MISTAQIDPLIENGTAYDRASVATGPARKLALPKGATVKPASANSGRVDLFLAKRLAWGGHPGGEQMSIRDERSRIGVATTSVGDTLFVATRGEWANMEGGADVALIAHVPAGLIVEFKTGLSGPYSAAQAGSQRTFGQGNALGERPSPEGTAAAAEHLPSTGWSSLSDQPDSDWSPR